MLKYMLECEWNIFERTQNNGEERRRFNIKFFCANAVFIICMCYFSSVKILLFKNAGRMEELGFLEIRFGSRYWLCYLLK